MIKLTDLYLAINTLLYSKYDKLTYKIYGHEVVEGYSKPSFFVDLVPKKNSNDTINFKSKAFSIIITYHQKTADEIDNLTKADEIIELFGYMLTVNNRKIPITDSDYDFVGENSDILQVSLEIEYYEANERIDTSQVASNLTLN